MLKIISNTGKTFSVEDKSMNGSISGNDIVAVGKNSFHLIRNGKSYLVDVIKTDWQNKTISLRIEGKKYVYQVKDKYDEMLEKLGMGGQVKNIKDLKAPMPGKVLEVLVSDGQKVEKDQPLIVLEAMKMENVIKSPGEAAIKNIIAKKGAAVEKNQVLINFE